MREAAACQDLGFVAPAVLVAAMDMEASLLLIFDFGGERSREDWTTWIFLIPCPLVMGKKIAACTLPVMCGYGHGQRV